jgi:3-isopropylmalate/(R)-2-methylmalate dehydratase small subunit
VEKFTQHTGVAAPLMRINIDTDAIIPSKEMKRVSKEGLGEGLFANWRYSDVAARTENPDFVLNQTPYRQATILLSGLNFGCGSSREHAVWALKDWGIRAIIAPSFGSIFYGNCVRNGILPIRLDEETLASWAAQIEVGARKRQISIDLVEQTVTGPHDDRKDFEIAPADREMLLEGLDAIAVTLKHKADIEAFRERDRQQRGWAYLDAPTQENI